jgi:hypothetical protein
MIDFLTESAGHAELLSVETTSIREMEHNRFCKWKNMEWNAALRFPHPPINTGKISNRAFEVPKVAATTRSRR